MFTDLRTALRPGLVLLGLLTPFCGLLYPVFITGVAQVVLPAQANGSLIRVDGRVIGSALIGQTFVSPGYFHGRPSAAGKGYDASASSGSNLGPTSATLRDNIAGNTAAARRDGLTGPVPADLVTSSGSGLDPDLTPAAALAQVDRVAAARSLPPAALRQLIARTTDQPWLGLVGEPRVNVLALNRQVDALAAQKR